MGKTIVVLRARITADWSMAAHRRGDVPRATRLAEDALAQARRARDERALAQALNIIGILSADQRRLEESLAIAGRVGDEATRIAALNNLADLLHRSGRQDEAMRELRRAARLFSEIGGDEAAMQPEVWKLVHSGERRTRTIQAGNRGASGSRAVG